MDTFEDSPDLQLRTLMTDFHKKVHEIVRESEMISYCIFKSKVTTRDGELSDKEKTKRWYKFMDHRQESGRSVTEDYMKEIVEDLGMSYTELEFSGLTPSENPIDVDEEIAPTKDHLQNINILRLTAVSLKTLLETNFGYDAHGKQLDGSWAFRHPEEAAAWREWEGELRDRNDELCLLLPLNVQEVLVTESTAALADLSTMSPVQRLEALGPSITDHSRIIYETGNRCVKGFFNWVEGQIAVAETEGLSSEEEENA